MRKIANFLINFALLCAWLACFAAFLTPIPKSNATKTTNKEQQFEISQNDNYNNKKTVTLLAKDAFKYAPQYTFKNKFSNIDVAILTVNAYYEANNQGIEGMQFVNSVVLNRIAKSMCNSVFECVTQKNQFSWMAVNPKVASMVLQAKHNIFSQNIIKEANKPIYNNARQSVQITLCGANCFKDVSFNQATYYYNPDFASTNGKKFFKTVDKTIKIGDHIGGIK